MLRIARGTKVTRMLLSTPVTGISTPGVLSGVDGGGVFLSSSLVAVGVGEGEITTSPVAVTVG
jgi:hypothetical protein